MKKFKDRNGEFLADITFPVKGRMAPITFNGPQGIIVARLIIIRLRFRNINYPIFTTFLSTHSTQKQSCLLNFATFFTVDISQRVCIFQGVLPCCKSAKHADPHIFYTSEPFISQLLTSIPPSQHAWSCIDSYQKHVFNPFCCWEYINARNRKHIQGRLSFAGKYPILGLLCGMGTSRCFPIDFKDSTILKGRKSNLHS